MANNIYAYARVSTKKQNEDRQVESFLKEGISLKNIIIEKTSGKTFNRKEYNKLFKKLKSGDTLFIQNLDRLGRDYNGILEEWRKLTKGKRVKIKVMDTPFLDTDKDFTSLIDEYLRDLTLLSLAFQAEQEWINIKSRQAKGIEVAKEKGKHLGRPKSKFLYNKKDFMIIEKWKNREISESVAIEQLGKGRTTFYKIAKIYEKQKESD